MTSGFRNTAAKQLAAALGDLGAWPAFAPTITQSGIVAYNTLTAYSDVARVGQIVTWAFNLPITGIGTGNNRVLITLPFAVTAVVVGAALGSGMIFHASPYLGNWEVFSTTQICLKSTASTTDVWGISPNLGLANGDVARGTVTYEAAA